MKNKEYAAIECFNYIIITGKTEPVIELVTAAAVLLYIITTTDATISRSVCMQI